jgi:hypothetical protein
VGILDRRVLRDLGANAGVSLMSVVDIPVTDPLLSKGSVEDLAA